MQDSVYPCDISHTLLRSLQENLITFTLVVEFEQAETLPIAEDEANCGHPHPAILADHIT